MNSEINSKARFKALLAGYKRMKPEGDRELLPLARRLLNGFKMAQNQGKKLQATTADDFNLLDTLQVAGEEIRHSMLLAWLLRREDTHAQGNLGFRMFLQEFGLSSKYAKAQYRVSREKRGSVSRIDVEVAAHGKFVIHIENKIYSEEIYSDDGDHQTEREWIDLLHRAQDLEVQPKDVHGLYLTLDGHRATCPEFRPISWKQVADLLDRYADLSKADQVSLFAAHYAQALRRLTFEFNQENEDEHETLPESET
jgi:hypothetical protein